MTEPSEELQEVRKRILLDFQVQRGVSVWAPWGKTGWSAVEIKRALRKKAEGMRVKPKTGEEVAKGKVPKNRLLKRDPKLKGKDRPTFTPDEVFAALEEQEQQLAEQKPELVPEKKPEPKPVRKAKPLTEEEERDRHERIKRLFDLIDDDSTTDDW